MLEKYILPGEKVEMQQIDRRLVIDGESEKKVYQSRVYDVISEDRIEIAMPMEKTKLILLPVEGEFDLYFYSQDGLYQCFARVIDRYKKNSVYILLVELTSNLRKYQRREYYRFSCALEINTRELEEAELSAIEKNSNYLVPGLPLKRSAVVDISGGGLRFVATYKYEKGRLIFCRYTLLVNHVEKTYEIVGKVLSVKELENRPGEFEHRVQYINLDKESREEIIRFIFEEERKHRKRETGF